MFLDTLLSMKVTGGETFTSGVFDTRIPSDLNLLNKAFTFTDGTGASKAMRMGSVTGSLLAGASANIDLRAIPSPSGNIVFVKIKALILINSGADPSNVMNWGNVSAPANVWTKMVSTGVLKQPPDSVSMMMSRDASGWITTATDRILQVINNGTVAATYTAIIIGEV